MRRCRVKSSSPHRGVQPPGTELRLVLLGRTGSGKSATGNTILDRQCFPSKLSMCSVTKQCQKENGVVQGRRLAVIDTPGWFDTDQEQNELEQEVLRCMVMCSPGPHAFLLVIPIARFTGEQQQTVAMIEKVFEEKICQHTIIIFTRADELEGQTIEEFISEQGKTIQDLTARFGNRFLAFNNKNPENRDQVERLLVKLDEMLEQNENRHFSNEKTEVVDKALRLLEQKKQEKLAESIKKAKQEVQQMAESRRAAIIKARQEETQRINVHMSEIQDKIHLLTAEIAQETKNPGKDRLQSLQESLQSAQTQLRTLGRERSLKIRDSIEKEKELEIWKKVEEEKREQEEKEKASTEDESKWYYDEKYFTILKYLIVFLGGVGLTFTPALFLAPAAPLTAELTAMLGPEIAAAVIAMASKAAPLLITARNVAPMVTSLCSIQ